jgi:hypothetical protein
MAQMILTRRSSLSQSVSLMMAGVCF